MNLCWAELAKSFSFDLPSQGCDVTPAEFCSNEGKESFWQLKGTERGGWEASGQPLLGALCALGSRSCFSEAFLMPVCFSKTCCLDSALVLLHLSEHRQPLRALDIAHGDKEARAAPKLAVPVFRVVGHWPCPRMPVAPCRPTSGQWPCPHLPVAPCKTLQHQLCPPTLVVPRGPWGIAPLLWPTSEVS